MQNSVLTSNKKNTRHFRKQLTELSSTMFIFIDSKDSFWCDVKRIFDGFIFYLYHSFIHSCAFCWEQESWYLWPGGFYALSCCQLHPINVHVNFFFWPDFYVPDDSVWNQHEDDGKNEFFGSKLLIETVFSAFYLYCHRLNRSIAAAVAAEAAAAAAFSYFILQFEIFSRIQYYSEYYECPNTHKRRSKTALCLSELFLIRISWWIWHSEVVLTLR